MIVESAADNLDIPVTFDAVLDPSWLQRALAPLSGGRAVTQLSTLDRIQSFAAKVRFAVHFEGSNVPQHFCLKGFLDPAIAQRAADTAVREALFYQRIAPHISMRVPRAIVHVNRQQGRAIILMEDLIHEGAHFCSALEPFSADLAAQTLDQIARLHAASDLLRNNDWIPSRLSYLATSPHFDAVQLQSIMDDGRTTTLARRTADAALLLRGMKKLAACFADSATTILHGDCHAGNFYLTAQGPGLTDWQLIQHGNWAQDVSYHIAAVLPEDVAEREERALLAHYLDRLHAHGANAPAFAQAWSDYRTAQIYGFYHWAITTRVEPQIVNTFMQRLGAGIERHDSYTLLTL